VRARDIRAERDAAGEVTNAAGDTRERLLTDQAYRKAVGL